MCGSLSMCDSEGVHDIKYVWRYDDDFGLWSLTCTVQNSLLFAAVYVMVVGP